MTDYPSPITYYQLPTTIYPKSIHQPIRQLPLFCHHAGAIAQTVGQSPQGRTGTETGDGAASGDVFGGFDADHGCSGGVASSVGAGAS